MAPLIIESQYNAALAILRQGGLVAVPTETVYGLAADATNKEAVAKIYQAKGRPSFNPLIAHISDIEMAERFAVLSPLSRQLAAAFWPGPLTLVLPLLSNTCGGAPSLADNVTAGLNTVAMRQPKGAMARLAHDLNAPLAAPSANSSGRISPTRADHVHDDLGSKVGLILDGGACMVGVESTIVKCDENGCTLLREGGLAREEIEQITGPLLRAQGNPKVEAPGMLLAHYAPRCPVRVNATKVATDEALLAFGQQAINGTPSACLNLSKEANLDEAAHNLFAMMKELDGHNPRCIAVQKIPSHGLGAALNDRLKRAAHQ